MNVKCKMVDIDKRPKAPGDMYYSAPSPKQKDATCWMHGKNCPEFASGLGHLYVILPNGAGWAIDSRSSNCTRPTDKIHRCWVRHGTPPNITVDKNGDTCQAGGGSIMVSKVKDCGKGYHGFLRNGELVEC